MFLVRVVWYPPHRGDTSIIQDVRRGKERENWSDTERVQLRYQNFIRGECTMTLSG